MRATPRRVFVAGPAGRIECAVDSPESSPRGFAVIAHPHPQFGGRLDNKVVQTLARAFVELGYESWRPNFRGVGESEGSYDAGRGEVDDLEAVLAHLKSETFVLAGFSFGAAMQARLAQRKTPERMVLVGVAVANFEVPRVAAGTLVVPSARGGRVPPPGPGRSARPPAPPPGASPPP